MIYETAMCHTVTLAILLSNNKQHLAWYIVSYTGVRKREFSGFSKAKLYPYIHSLS